MLVGLSVFCVLLFFGLTGSGLMDEKGGPTTMKSKNIPIQITTMKLTKVKAATIKMVIAGRGTWSRLMEKENSMESMVP